LIDIFTSRVLLELIGGTASIVVLTVFFASLGAMQWPQDIVLVLGGWLLLCWSGFALACIVGVLSERSRFFASVWSPFNFLLFHASGTFFMVDWLPRGLQEAVLWVPMLHGVEMVRHGYFGASVITYENPMYLVATNLVLTLVGLALVRISGRRVQPR
jgi:capsular polysaccharide transport system permease protein